MIKDNAKGLQQVNDNVILTLLGKVFSAIGIPVIIGMTLWGAGEFSAMRDKVTAMTVQLNDLVKDQYHGEDAKRDFQWRDELVKALARREDKLEGRVDALEVGQARGHR